MTNYQKQIDNITDMIRGEINRMCVTDNLAELDAMHTYSVKNLEKLHELMYQRWKERKVNNADSN